MDDRGAFLKIFLRHEAEIRALIRAMLRDRSAREDVFQEVALTLWERFSEYDAQRPFGPWARAIAANKVLQQHHKDARFRSAFSEAAAHALRHAFDRSEPRGSDMADALEDCIEPLPEHSRQMLALKYEHDLKVETIAERMGRTANAVYQALCRLRVRLEECVRNRLSAEGASHD